MVEIVQPGGGGGTAADIKVGVTTITSGTNTRILYDNAGVLGEYTLTGTGTVVAMQTSPVFVTPTLGVATATSLSGALNASRLTNAFGTSSIYTAFVLGNTDGATGDNGGLYAVARRVRANEPFTALSGWDDGVGRYLYFGGGGWSVPDATQLLFFTAPTYTESNDTGLLRWKILSDGHFLAGLDNTYDIGASGATRPRSIYYGTNMVGGTAQLTRLGLGAAADATAALLIKQGTTSAAGGIQVIGTTGTNVDARLYVGGASNESGRVEVLESGVVKGAMYSDGGSLITSATNPTFTLTGPAGSIFNIQQSAISSSYSIVRAGTATLPVLGGTGGMIALGNTDTGNVSGGLFFGSPGSNTAILGTTQLYFIPNSTSVYAQMSAGALSFKSGANGTWTIRGDDGSNVQTNIVLMGSDAPAPGTMFVRGGNSSGSNAAGALLTLAAGTGTGNAASGDVLLQTSMILGSGTTAQTLGDRQRILGKYTTLTESSATAFASVTVASGTVSGGVIEYTVEANDATDYQALTGAFTYAIVNKGGTSTIVLGTDNQASSCSSGTLTGTITAVDAGSGVIQFKMNAVSSLTQTVLRINAQVRKNIGTGAIAAV